MGDPVGAIVGAVVSGVTTLVSGSMSRDATAEANAANREQTQNLFDQEKELSNTAHQREVADLKDAGLNPVLSAGGSGASVPSASAIAAEPNTGLADAMGKAMSSGFSSYSAYQSIAKNEADTQLSRALTLKAGADASSAMAAADRDLATAAETRSATATKVHGSPALSHFIGRGGSGDVANSARDMLTHGDQALSGYGKLGSLFSRKLQDLIGSITQNSAMKLPPPPRPPKPNEIPGNPWADGRSTLPKF